jgi:hypothetical protein
MPYKNPEDKKRHNDRYHVEKKVELMITRMQKRGQTRISRRGYDEIKDTAPQEWLQTLKIIGADKLKATPTTSDAEKQRVRQKRAKITPDRVKDLIDTMNIADRTKKNYKSMVNSLVKLLCVEDKDFTCIYTKINQKISLIIREYKNPNPYLQFMKSMVDNHEPIRRLVPTQNRNILNRRAASESTRQEAKKIEVNQQRDRETDWVAEYDKMVQHEANTDELKAIKKLYIDGVYNDKGVLTMIPRSYFYDTVVVQNQKNIDKSMNYYVKSSGTLIINSYKTSKQYGTIKYRLPKAVRATLNKYIGAKPRLFGSQNETTMLNKVRESLGVGIDDYRRIMKNKAQRDGYSVEAIAKAMAHQPTTGKVSY